MNIHYNITMTKMSLNTTITYGHNQCDTIKKMTWSNCGYPIYKLILNVSCSLKIQVMLQVGYHQHRVPSDSHKTLDWKELIV